MDVFIIPLGFILTIAACTWCAILHRLIEDHGDSAVSVVDKFEDLYHEIMQGLPMVLRPFFLLTYPIWMLAHLLLVLTPFYLIIALYLVGPVVCFILFVNVAGTLI